MLWDIHGANLQSSRQFSRILSFSFFHETLPAVVLCSDFLSKRGMQWPLWVIVVLLPLLAHGTNTPCKCHKSHPLQPLLQETVAVAPGLQVNASVQAGAFRALTSFSGRSEAVFVIADAQGAVVYSKPDLWLTAPKWVNATTVAAIGSRIRPETDFRRLADAGLYPNHPVLFNVLTGDLLEVPFQYSKKGRLHHDIEYNPRTETFLAIVNYETAVPYLQVAFVLRFALFALICGEDA